MNRYRYIVVVALVVGVMMIYMMGRKSITPYRTDNKDKIRRIISSDHNNARMSVPPEAELRRLSWEEVSRMYHSYVRTVQVHCQMTIRPGRPGDGGWYVCVDPPYRLAPPCLVYSFGINYEFSFDDDMANKHGCDVHSYDPSMDQMTDHLRGQRVHFHKTGLNGTNTINKDGWRMRTFTSILDENQHSNDKIDVLKIDIECSELSALPEMLKSGSLRHVKQLCFEMHLKRYFQPEPDKDKYIYGLSIFRDLYKEGFRIFKSHRNMYPKYTSKFGMVRTGCHEMYMIRIKL